MTIDTGVVVSLEDSASQPLENLEAIAVFGTCTTGTIVAATLTLVESTGDKATILGDGGAGDTLPQAVEVLQRYGCGRIIACKIEGVDAAAEEADLIAQLDLLLNAQGSVGYTPTIILAPSFNSDAVVTKAVATAEAIAATAILNFTAGTAVAAAITERGLATGLGQKQQRLITTFPHLKNKVTPTNLEGMDVHLAGIMAGQSYGLSPFGQLLKGVEGTDITMSFSLGSDTADTESLTDAGIVTTNLDVGANEIVWGTRNASFVQGTDEGSLTFINAMRARDAIAVLAKARASKFLGRPSRYATAELLSQSYRQMLTNEIQTGAIAGYSTVSIDITKTNYANFVIWHNIGFQVFLPVEKIGVDVFLQVVNV